MITIQYDHLLDGNFVKGLSKLSQWGEGSAKTKAVIGKIAKDYSSQAKKVMADMNKTIDVHCDKNEDGSRVAAPNTENTYVISDENLPAWNADMSQPAMKLKHRRLNLDELGNVPLLPLEIVALEPILDLDAD